MSHTDQNFAGRIRESGYRLTPQRQIILDILCDLGGHVPVTALVGAVQDVAPAIDKATVYRTVGFFDELGLVVCSDIDGATVVELSVSDDRAHSHLVCRDCGHVEHIPESVLGDLRLRLASDYGFAADLDRLTLEGTCNECSARPDANIEDRH